MFLKEPAPFLFRPGLDIFRCKMTSIMPTELKLELNYIIRNHGPAFQDVQVNLCQKLFFLQNMGRTYCIQKLF